MTFRERKSTLIACLTLATVVALPSMALAEDDKTTPTETGTTDSAATGADHQVSEVLTTLPVLGTGLSLTITRDETGAIASVGLDPADAATVIKEKDHKVVFLLSDEDTVVVVKARGGSVRTKVKADATADVTGPGSWSADVFGNGIVTIPYTVTFDGITPTITIGEVIAPDGVIAEVDEAKTRTSDDGDKSFYKVKVKLTSDDERAKVTFVAKVSVNDEGESKVRLAVDLKSYDRFKDRDDDRRDQRDRHDDDDDRRRDKSDRDDDKRGDHRDRDKDRDDDDDNDDNGET
ncbi:MAG TPA: hypothetical protein VMS99_02330 [Acidimicrobiia bacterium]|nr:hypothetical protein [Acidimicrobiia bacterium]